MRRWGRRWVSRGDGCGGLASCGVEWGGGLRVMHGGMCGVDGCGDAYCMKC